MCSWKTIGDLILSNIRLTDEECNLALHVLERVKYIYDDYEQCPEKYPERIVLTNYQGIPLHTILNRNGIPDTVYISPKPKDIYETIIQSKIFKITICVSLISCVTYCLYSYYT